MSSLFYTGQSRRTNGAFSVTMKDGAKLAKKLEKLKDGGETAIKRTVSDFTSRAPAWVSKGIRQHYGVDTAAIKEAGPRSKRGATSIRVSGVSVDGASLEYKGRTLTPIHFKMSPTTRNPKGLAKKPAKVPGQAISTGSPVTMVRPPMPFQVKATIIKVHAVRTLSVPQMIGSEEKKSRASDTISEIINEKLEKRFNHHIEQAMK